MRTRARHWSPGIGAAIVIWSATAFAQTAIAPGVEIEPGSEIGIGVGNLLWMTAPNEATVYDVSLEIVRCFTSTNDETRGTLAGAGWVQGRLAVDPTTDEMYVVSAGYQATSGVPAMPGIQIVRTDCGTTLDLLHETFQGDDAAWDIEPIWRSQPFAFADNPLPMSSDGRIYIPTADAIWSWSPAAPTTAPTQAFSTSALTAATTLAPDAGWSIVAAAPVDDGLVIGARPVGVASSAAWLFHVSGAGDATLLATDLGRPAPLDLSNRILFESGWARSAQLDAILAPGVTDHVSLAVIPADRPLTAASFPRPLVSLFSTGPQISRYVGGTGGAVYAVTGPNVGPRMVQPVSFDLSKLDVDGNSVPWAAEVAMSMDDRVWDDDGDGTSDAAEMVLYATDPTRASDRPDFDPGPVTLGVSSLIDDWGAVQPDQGIMSPPALAPFTTRAFGRARLCADEGGKCRDDEGGVVEGKFDYVEIVAPLDAARVIPVTEGPAGLAELTPRTLTELYGTQQEAVWRNGSQGATAGSFAVVDPSRTDCPLAFDAADQAQRCASGHDEVVDATETAIFGSDLRRSLLLGLGTGRGWQLIAADDERVERVDDGRIFGGWRPVHIVPLPDVDRFLVEAVKVDAANQATYRWYLADPNLLPVTKIAEFNELPRHLGGSFREGPLVDPVLRYNKPNQQLGTGGPGVSFACNSGICWYDPGGPSVPFVGGWLRQIAQFVVVSSALEAGDVLVASQGSETLLWRITRMGAVVPWLTYPMAGQLSADPAVAPMDPTRARSMDVRADGKAICIVEADSDDAPTGRIWEVGVGADGAPATVELVVDDASVEPSACGYDADGNLHWATTAGIESASGTTAPTPSGRVRHMRWFAGQWVIVTDARLDIPTEASTSTSEAFCVNDGDPLDLGPRQAIDVQDALAYLLSFDGSIDVVAADELCAADGPTRLEHFLAVGAPEAPPNIWSSAFDVRLGIAGKYEPGGASETATGVWRTTHASLVVRPDRLVLASAGHVWRGRGAEPPEALIWRFRGAYYPEDPDNRFEELDPLRREGTRAAPMTLDVRGTTMAKVPGASNWAPDDYQVIGTPVQPRDPYAGFAPPMDDPDAPGDDMGNTPSANEKGGCRCSSAPGRVPGGLLLIFAFLGWRRRQ